MLEGDGQIGLELRSFSRRKNGNSGSSLYFFLTVIVIHLCLFNNKGSACSIAVKLARQREQWSLAWVALICLELLFLEPC